MKTLILYGTKHGGTKELAQRIAKKMGEGVTLHDLREGAPSLEGVDQVLVGSSVYAGMMRKEVLAFLKEHTKELLEKPLGLFLCCMDPSGENQYFAGNRVPEELLRHAKAKAALGGVMDAGKCNVLERLVVRIATKGKGSMDRLDEGKIGEFVGRMQ